MLEMNPEIREKWTAELRSGKYKQGATNLRKDDAFCCLGVLCELAVEAGVVEHTGFSKLVSSGTNLYLYDGAVSLLPPTVMDWAGISESLPDAIVDGERVSLSDSNDHGVPFEKIADYIDGGQA